MFDQMSGAGNAISETAWDCYSADENTIVITIHPLRVSICAGHWSAVCRSVQSFFHRKFNLCLDARENSAARHIDAAGWYLQVCRDFVDRTLLNDSRVECLPA